VQFLENNRWWWARTTKDCRT